MSHCVDNNRTRNNSELTVVHSFPTWLPQTHTWMYSQVMQLQQIGVQAHVVCKRTRNLDQFSVADIHSLENEHLVRQIWEKVLLTLGIRHHLNYLVDVCGKVNAGIVHSHFGYQGWADLDAVRELGARHVVTFYGKDVSKLPKQNPTWLKRYKRMFTEGDLFLCEGSHMASCLVAIGCPKNKIRVQHLGVNVDEILFQARQWRTSEPLRVLIAASFREKKGIVPAIKALDIVSRDVEVELTIIGDAGKEVESQREKQLIYSALEDSELKEKVRLLGYMDHVSMLQEAYGHHLFLQPSVTALDGDTEGGAPVAIVEMLASGMPVVATTHCDIPEVVGSGFSRYLAPERDVVELSNRIMMLLRESGKWPSLLREGRKHIEREYDWRMQAKRLADHYREILSDVGN